MDTPTVIACKDLLVGDEIGKLSGRRGTEWHKQVAVVTDVRWTSARGGSGWFRVKPKQGHPFDSDLEQVWTPGSKVKLLRRPGRLHVGHYGCSAADRVVKVLAPHNGKPHWTTTWNETCPACGEEHRIRPFFRVAKPGEVERAEATLGEIPAPAAGEAVAAA